MKQTNVILIIREKQYPIGHLYYNTSLYQKANVYSKYLFDLCFFKLIDDTSLTSSSKKVRMR